MRTKEEIIKEYAFFSNSFTDKSVSMATLVYKEDALKAMDEYAKEVAIDYAHYILGKMFPYMVNGGAPNPEAEKLFDKYQQEKSSLK